MATDDERDLLLKALETAVTLRRVDALVLLHQCLRVWIPVHVVSTALMLGTDDCSHHSGDFFKVR